MEMIQLIWIAIAGAFGTVSRYYLSGWVYGLFGSRLPYGTLAVNVIGSFLIVFVMGIALQTMISDILRTSLTIGFLGAFTTFSTFTYETLSLIEKSAWTAAFLNIVLNLFLTLIAGGVGLISARALLKGAL